MHLFLGQLRVYQGWQDADWMLVGSFTQPYQDLVIAHPHAFGPSNAS